MTQILPIAPAKLAPPKLEAPTMVMVGENEVYGVPACETMAQAFETEMKKYPSKISYSLVLMILTIIIVSTIPLVSPPIWSGLLINLMVLVFISHLLLSTYYLIDGKFLVVKSGFVVNKKIDINTIGIVSETNSIISAPAASFDRLNIVYKQHNSILISPRDKTEFIDHIKRINPKIEIQYKANKNAANEQ